MKVLQKHKLTIALTGCVLALALFVMFDSSKGNKAAPHAMPPPVVEVVAVEQRDVPLTREWIGTLDGLVNAEIRAQVAGYLLRQHYTEGAFVRKGQLLFEIDPRPLQAALEQAQGELAKAAGQVTQANGQRAQAEAQLKQAEAHQGKTQLDVNRYKPLAEQQAVTEEELANAEQADLAARAAVEAAKAGVATAQAAITAARAQVEAAQAAVTTAQVNLGFTKITAPIDGIAGVATAQVGNLVNPSSGALTTVSTVDPIKVWFTLSEQEYLAYAKGGSGKWNATNKQLELELVLAEGSTWPRQGRFYFADRQVDQKTGAIRLAGLFPNPGNTLRPGQYGKVRAVTSVKHNALLVPQRAVAELQGGHTVVVVGADNKVTIRPVTVGERIDALWIIESGLQVGERVVVEGTQKIAPGVTVNPQTRPLTKE